jgi:phage tail-like protein
MSDTKDASMKRREFLKGIGAAAGAAALASYADPGEARVPAREPTAQQREDPLIGFHYALELGGTVAGFFTEVSGIGSEHEIVEYEAGGEESDPIGKVPGRLKWQDITLKRPTSSELAVWRWRQLVIEDKVENARMNGDVVALDRRGDEVARWHFENGWPSKATAYESEGGVLMEELQIAHEGIRRKP